MDYKDEELEPLIQPNKDEQNYLKYCTWSQLALLILSISFLVAGIIMDIMWPQIINNIIKSKLEFQYNTQTYKYWQEVPLQMNIYIFNWTNPEATIQKKNKAILQQLGPYVFKEKRTKVDITFNKNGTVSYRQLKSWQFDPILSNGSLSDYVTTINIVLNIVGDKLQIMNQPFFYIITNIVLSYLRTKTYVTKTVGALIFDGYEDNLLNLMRKFKILLPVDIPPFDKVGWMYGMNMSTSADGLVNMFTGKYDVENIGLVNSVNYSTKLNVFNKDCSLTNASTGDLWPKHSTLQPNVSIYIPNFCSAITMTNNNHKYINGIKSVEFVAGSDVFNNTCYCPSTGCMLPGVRSLSLCGKNALPVLISFPHFYLADELYRQSIIGMKPNQDLHEFKINLENDYSIPLQIAARLQFNIKMRPIKKLQLLENVPEVVLPLFWFSESYDLPVAVTIQLWIVNNILTYIPYVWVLMILTGCIMLLIIIFLWITR